jgi:hypothetical protein
MLATALLAVSACSGTDTRSPGHTPSHPAAEESSMTTIRITVGDRPITAHFADNPTAQDLAAQLPLALDFRDFNGLEKIGEIPRALTMDRVPAGDDPEIADIGYYAPSNNLVLYYGDVGYWKGIVRIGGFNADDVDFIKRQPDGFRVSIERD